MADGRNFENGFISLYQWFYRFISAENHPISMKFCVPTQILVPRTVTS